MEGQRNESMNFKEFCVSSVDLGFENPSERMKEGRENIEDLLHDVPSKSRSGSKLRIDINKQ